MRLEIVEEREGGVIVLRLLGALDITTIDELRSQIIAALDRDPPAIALDLSLTTFVDSSGLGSLVSGKRRALEKEIGYFIVDCPEPLRELLTLVGLDRLIDFCSRQELRERFAAPKPKEPAAAGRRR